MINEEKVKLMTRMAVLEDTEGQIYNIAANYSKKDFVSLHLVVAFFAQTILYVVIYLLALAILFATVFVEVKIATVVVVTIVGMAGYVMHSYFYMRWIAGRIEAKYEEAAMKQSEMVAEYEKLEEIINPKQNLEV